MQDHGQSSAGGDAKGLRWVEALSPAAIAVSWVWYLERESGIWLPWQTYVVLALAALSVTGLAIALTSTRVDGGPEWSAHAKWSGISLLAACAAIAIAVPKLSASLVIAALILSPGALIFVLYAQSLRKGRSIVLPLEMFAALIMTVACALPMADQRGDLMQADPALIAKALAEGGLGGNIALLFALVSETLARALHYQPAQPFFALFLCQRLLLARPSENARRAHRAGSTIPWLAAASPALACVLLVAALAGAVFAPLASMRLMFALTACASALLLVAHRLVSGPPARRHLALDAAVILPFFAAGLILGT